jgi:hypothetical protein
MTPDESDKPLPLRSVLTKPVIVTLANYAMLTLLNGALESYFPLVWSTPVEFGGLNLNPASIGMWLSLYGGMNGIFQLFFFSHFISRFGPRRVFVFSIVSSAVILTIFPFENLALVAGGGSNLVVWLLIIMQLSSLCVFDMGYGKCLCPYTLAHDTHGTRGVTCVGTMYMYISSAAPNKRSLGTVYGLSQVASSVQSVVGPAAADRLFAFSLTYNVLGGNFAYVVFVGVVCVAMGVSTRLPKNPS